uniref:Uncharacterized protein n=1 Tax=viral metagenome TaxID=1070528 RepID=A0A6H1ZDL5_9ZZZZ
MDDDSIADFYRAPTRYLAESTSKESEFEKPYLDENYRRMHFNFPTPDWPSMPEFPPWPPWPDLGKPVPKLSWCGIICYPPAFGECEEDPAWCKAWVYCTGEHPGFCYPCTWEFEGDFLSYEPDGPNKILVWVDSTKAKENPGNVAYVQAKMTDPCGNVCRTEFEVTCKVCPPDVVMTWDTTLSATTIGRSTSVSIYVKDGLGPYKWSVTGTGFSISFPTGGVHNVLVADATACGAATITVTDFCDTVVTNYVRGTEASVWVEKTANTCVMPGPATFVSLVGSNYNYEYVIGNKKQTDVASSEGGGFELACPDPCDDPTCAGGVTCAPYADPPACLTDMINGDGRPTTIPCTKAIWVSEYQYYCYSAAIINQDYFEWECSP